MSRPKALSLFAGCGGDTLGLERAGFDVVGFVEWDKNAAASHHHNFPDCIQLGGDITAIKDEQFAEYKSSVDLIFAGFPCQGFSHAGKKDPHDKRNHLFWEFLRAVQIIQPRWAIGENVKGLLTKKTPDGELVRDLIVREFNHIGYHMTTKVLKMTNYGVPQKRERLFFVGWRADVIDSYVWPREISEEKQLSLVDIIEPDMKNTIAFDATHMGPIQYVRVPDDQKPDNNPHKYLQLLLERKLLSYAKRVSPHHGEIIDISRPAKTIICTYQRQPRLFVPLQNARGTYLRTLNVRELQQLQGFPKEFTLIGTTVIQQIGNAVPPNAVTEIAREIRQQDISLKRS